MVTKLGTAKKTLFREYDSRNQTLVAIKLVGDDEVVSVRTTTGENDMLIFTANGKGSASRKPICGMGRATQGVRGIRLRAGDEVVARHLHVDGPEVLLLTSNGLREADPDRTVPRPGPGRDRRQGDQTDQGPGPFDRSRRRHQGERGLPDLFDRDRHPHPGRQDLPAKRDSTGVRVMNVGAGSDLGDRRCSRWSTPEEDRLTASRW